MTIPVAQSQSQSHPLPKHPESSPFLKPEYVDIVKYLEKFADGPMPTRWQDKWQWEMSNVHLFLMRMVERAYLFAPFADERADLANYLGYAEICFFQVYNHHHGEEEFIFPTFAKHASDDIWLRNVEEHHTFDTPLHAAWLYVRACRQSLVPKASASPVPAPTAALVEETDMSLFPDLDTGGGGKFDPAGFRRHLESFIVPLAQHLSDEIDTLTPELMDKVGQDGEESVRKWLDKHLREYDPAWFLCSAFSSAPITLCKQLIVLPFFVRRVLVPFILAPKYKGFWYYAPFPENLTWKGTK